MFDFITGIQCSAMPYEAEDLREKAITITQYQIWGFGKKVETKRVDNASILFDSVLIFNGIRRSKLPIEKPLSTGTWEPRTHTHHPKTLSRLLNNWKLPQTVQLVLLARHSPSKTNIPFCPCVQLNSNIPFQIRRYMKWIHMVCNMDVSLWSYLYICIFIAMQAKYILRYSNHLQMMSSSSTIRQLKHSSQLTRCVHDRCHQTCTSRTSTLVSIRKRTKCSTVWRHFHKVQRSLRASELGQSTVATNISRNGQEWSDTVLFVFTHFASMMHRKPTIDWNKVLYQ